MSDRLRAVFLVLLLALLPVLTWWVVTAGPSLRGEPEVFSGGTSYAASPIPFERTTIGSEPVGMPLITNVQILDFDGDGANDILVCDATRNRVSLISPTQEEGRRERVLIEDVVAPAHATVVDIDGDGDQDVIVSVLGNIMPDDLVIGRVELFERVEDEYVRHVILEDVRRVADVQPADFDGDGDIDLAVAVFGYSRGAVMWLENRGDLQFRDHELLNAPGTIHVPISDYDGDGDPDIMAIVTQDEEELWGFENLGDGRFEPRRLWFTVNHDFGSAGLVKADLDQDGDDDLILPVGDNLEDLDAYPQPYHGCYWFENRGDWEFTFSRLSDLGGTYAAGVGDIDSDGDIDIALVSMTNNWAETDNASVVWLENDGAQNFQTWEIDTQPIHLVTVAVGDVDGDGKPDIVGGGLNFRKPYERIGRVALWQNQQPSLSLPTQESR